jgi:hypothetical protein
MRIGSYKAAQKFLALASYIICVSLVCSQLVCKEPSSQDETPKSGCTLSTSESPEIRGFKLGMNQSEIEARFDGMKVSKVPDYGGSSYITIHPQPPQFHQKDSGVRQGSLGSDNSRVDVSSGRFS